MIEIPGYREAVAAEREERDYAFLELPRKICGIAAAPFTLHHLVTRLAIDCPFLGEASVMDRPDPAGEIASFIWHVSEARRRSLGYPLAEYHARNAFVRQIALVDTADAIVAIRDYLDVTFQDAPPPGRSKRPPIASIAGTLIDLFAAQYGWTRREVMHCPLEQIYQLIREITVRNNPKAVLFNRRSDKCRGAYLNSLNAAALAVPSGIPSAETADATAVDADIVGNPS